MVLANALFGYSRGHWLWAAECSGLSCVVLATGISRIFNTYEMKDGAFIGNTLTFGAHRALLGALEHGRRKAAVMFEFVRYARDNGKPVGGAGAAAPGSASAWQAKMMC
ncbi:hypothetical protein T492DRAFT_842627 [Pavlovales sp. CCMP2436]|nr:hypothetical protein T492DRAFT_842627 [Pavlovales sp. CCMP2436]